MLAITISWFLVGKMSEAFKNMIEHETHFIPNLTDEGLNALAIWKIIRKGGMEEVWRFGKVSTKSITSPIEVSWWKGWKEGSIHYVGGGSGFVHLGGKSSREFKYGCGEVGGVENMSTRGARGDGSFGCKGSVWLAIAGVINKARVVVIIVV
ncbi:hypothetical protein Tco_1549356 [Tanacetum coccineum]